MQSGVTGATGVTPAGVTRRRKAAANAIRLDETAKASSRPTRA